MEFGDFLEGVRAAIIDKDRNPNWQFNLTEVPQKASRSMLAPLDALELNVKES
jgi:3-hydroxyisobutyrate dehydrogenase